MSNLYLYRIYPNLHLYLYRIYPNLTYTYTYTVYILT